MHKLQALLSLDAVMLISALLLLTLQLHLCPASAWMPDVRPDLQPKQDIIIAKFLGNTTDYFKILDHDDATMLVGAKDVIYNISLNGLLENSRLEWYSSDADRELCALKGKHEADCHNYLRVFARVSDGKILICGTNSYKPRCRHYKPLSEVKPNTAPKYEIVYDVEAQGLCPYSPAHNSTYAYADDQIITTNPI
ncbi:semaphorin-1A-like [Teleopsis dalmanni]|uniref:semaphorin-1A-like n=1 Tax=Teleopsis dalmanni TaxID=139649 RepID=UPI0018CEBBCA|nr:semaphorin-1A-like [Teleopsis dalmanni]